MVPADGNIAPDALALEFADVIDLRPAGVTVDRGTELYLTQRATRPSRVAALVGDGLETGDILPIVARIENDEALLDGLSAQERLSYGQARDAGYTENQALALGRWNDPGLADAAAACRVANSFLGDTLVVLADGTMLPIAEGQVGDEVLAFDFDTGTTVAREVTATLPHTDWLLEAHLSDGSVMSVTEDHRFWSITDDAWVELQDLDTTDVLLTPHGATVTVDWLDWNAGQDAPAWDLTVEGVHNFFVAADGYAEPVLVHNQGSISAFCGVPVSPRHSALAGTDESLTPSQRSDLGLALRELGDESPSALDDVLDALVASGDDDTIRVLVGRAGEFPQQLKAAALKGWTDDYLTRPLLWTEDTLTFTGDVTRTVRFREPGPAVEDPANVWGVTDAHLNKHFFGPGDVSLGAKGLGDLPEWLDETQALLGSVARRTQTRTSLVDGVARTFETIRADGLGYKFEIVLHARDDGTYDLVTWLTKQD